MEKSLQGTLGAGTTTIYTCPIKIKTAVVSIKFNNAAAYVLSLSRYDAILANTVTVYNYNLAAGDTVLDTSGYVLFPGDYISITTSVGGTDYLLYIAEAPYI